VVDLLHFGRWREKIDKLGIFAWFIAVFVGIWWSQGLRPVAFWAPDEALNRSAALVIATTGEPFLTLPFADPENLAHARAWLSLGTKAIPVYAPVAIYVYALLTYLGTLGFVLIAALPASGVAALAAGSVRFLPRERRLLGLLAPALAMPALYWMLRPWMNISAMLVCLCWSVYFWSRYRETKCLGWLSATFAGVGLGAAIRPDYTPYLLAAVLLFAAGADPKRWKLVGLLALAAGAMAVALNLPLNHLITGKATRAAYQMEFELEDGPAEESSVPAPLRLLGTLLYPLGVPAPGTVVRLLWKYWVSLAPMAFITLGQFALWPLLRAKPRLERWLHGLALLAILMFLTSRMDPTTFGAASSASDIGHSIPRYWTPVYLLAPLAPLGWLARQSGRRWAVGVSIAAAVALFGALNVLTFAAQSLARIRDFGTESAERTQRLAEHVPKHAMIYGPIADKVLWAHYRVGFLDEPKPSAASIARAVAHRIPTFVWFRRKDNVAPLAAALEQHELELVQVSEIDREFRLYRVARARSRSAR
jgi:hypothetical protein